MSLLDVIRSMKNSSEDDLNKINENEKHNIEFCAYYLAKMMRFNTKSINIDDEIKVECIPRDVEDDMWHVEHFALFKIYVKNEVVFSGVFIFQWNTVDFDSLCPEIEVRMHIFGKWEEKIINYVENLIKEQEESARETHNKNDGTSRCFYKKNNE